MLEGLPTEEWLEAIEELMKIYLMIDIDKIQYVNLLLKGDAKVW